MNDVTIKYMFLNLMRRKEVVHVSAFLGARSGYLLNSKIL